MYLSLYWGSLGYFLIVKTFITTWAFLFLVGLKSNWCSLSTSVVWLIGCAVFSLDGSLLARVITGLVPHYSDFSI